jgi:hypothetical protein
VKYSKSLPRSLYSFISGQTPATILATAAAVSSYRLVSSVNSNKILLVYVVAFHLDDAVGMRADGTGAWPLPALGDTVSILFDCLDDFTH